MVHDGTPNNRKHVKELDGLRGLLALWVVIAHIFSWCGLLEVPLPHFFVYFWRQFIFGIPAVEAFMILSGFAISFLLHSRPQSYFSFMTGRFFRLYPVFLACFILGIFSSCLVPFILITAQWRGTYYFEALQLIYIAERHHMLIQIFSHLTLLNGLLPRYILHCSSSTFLPTAWSITLEWQYYWAAPLLALMVRSGRGLLLLILVVVLANRYGDPWQNLAFAFLPKQLPLFLIGIGSFRLYEWFSSTGNIREPISSLPVVVVLAVAIMGAPSHAIAVSIWAIVFGCVLVQGEDFFSRTLMSIRSFLLHRALQWLGKISYSLYLIHWPLLVGILWLILRYQPAISSGHAVLVLVAFGLPTIMGAAAVLSKYVEYPGMALGKKLLAAQQNRRPVPSTTSG